MCGILGWLCSSRAVDAQRFSTALDLLAHRGPDDRGIYSARGVLLGMRRLAILDRTAAGHQPMVHPASGAVLVFNGEIYNYLELRAELEKLRHRFIGQSDTEVLLHALVEWGEHALTRLNGMWSFAFWEPARQRLMLARDRFGVKPLYYRHEPDGLAFASEPKALLTLFPKHREISGGTLLNFLAHNLLYPGGDSFYRGIHVLPPAHYARYDLNDDTLCLVRYWEYPDDIDEALSPADAVEQFRELFDDAVRLRLRSDVPVGLTLSGGLDSTAVLTSASAHAGRPLTCFTSTFGNDKTGELEWACRGSCAVGAPLIRVNAVWEDWPASMRKIVWHMDGPGYTSAVYPLWRLMQQARADGVPVLLEGQGADEALAGYVQYAVLELLGYLSGKNHERRNVGGLWQRIHALRSTFSMRWAAAWLARELSPVLLLRHRQRVGFQSLLRAGVALPEFASPSSFSDGDAVRHRLLDDHSSLILPGLLHYGDAISMAHSIESRHPFMDYRLVEWMFRLPTIYKLREGETKWVLREYLRNHGQKAIGNREDKKGYPTPVGNWMAADGGREIEHLLIEAQGPLQEWCDPQKVRQLIAMNRAGAMAAGHHLYKLVSTQIWIDECIEGGSSI